MTEKILQNNPHPLGAHIESNGIRFSFVSRNASCGILLYDRKTGRLQKKIPFADVDRIGNIYCKKVEGIDPESCTYLFFQEDKIVPDERARVFPVKVTYGKARNGEDFKAGFLTNGFDWGEDRFPRIPYDRALGYCMHVRGFTKHASSNVKYKGTFAGITEKIPYLKGIGITTIELQPAYEFTEIPLKEEGAQNIPYMMEPGLLENVCRTKLNYWGYKKGYYYAPKAAYAAGADAASEFKEMVRALHADHMEVVMQFYFPREVNHSEILEILRFWVLEYHVDGFHLLGENLPADMLATDDFLADTKLWYHQFHTDVIYKREEQPCYPHVAEYNDAWYYEMRRFLKGDGNMLASALYQMRHIPEKSGHIHYLTNYYGLTLADMVSFDQKHNEANGEDNRDGADYNGSWNCGEEGPTRRQSVKKLRVKQMKNAMCMLLLSQSTPLIFMGDEFGNSQKGNNNPYCQDNAITWLDWSGTKKNAGLLEFWKMLVRFRHEHPILRPAGELRRMDYIACGYPDLSYHGQNAWSPRMEENHRHVGLLFCGKYARNGECHDESFLYLAINMHWENRELAMPKLPKGLKWEMDFCTEAAREERSAAFLKNISPRSMVMYISVPGNETEQPAVTEPGAEGMKKG